MNLGPGLGNETGSHQTSGEVPILVLFDRSIFCLSEDIVFYGQEYLLSKHPIVCFF